MSGFKPGDVLRYSPKGGMHARQGTAIVRDNGAAVDTYWSEEGRGDCYLLRGEELAGATLIFNVNDYERIGTVGHCAPSDEGKWLEYRPDDRQRIGSQHQYCAVLYVRKGSKPDLGTKIDNARQAVEEAERKLESAALRLEWRRNELAKLEAEHTSRGRSEESQ